MSFAPLHYTWSVIVPTGELLKPFKLYHYPSLKWLCPFLVLAKVLKTLTREAKKLNKKHLELMKMPLKVSKI